MAFEDWLRGCIDGMGLRARSQAGLPWGNEQDVAEAAYTAGQRAASADTERLDWLDEQKPEGWTQVLFEYLDGKLEAINFCNEGYDDDAQFYFGDTWREAIDAARSEEQG